MTIATDPSAIETNEYIKYFYEYFNFSSISIFLIYLGLFVLFLLGISATISIVTIWKLSIFANQIGTELADTLYSYYLGKTDVSFFFKFILSNKANHSRGRQNY